MAECTGLLNRRRGFGPYRGFESLSLRSTPETREISRVSRFSRSLERGEPLALSELLRTPFGLTKPKGVHDSVHAERDWRTCTSATQSAVADAEYALRSRLFCDKDRGIAIVFRNCVAL